MTATSNIKDRGLSEAEVREDIARRDRQGWFGATHASGQFGIIARDGAEVARCQNEKDRDTILRMAKSHDAMVAALGELLEQIECLGGIEFSKDLEPYKAEAVWDDAVGRAKDALALVRGAVPMKSTNELASTPGGIR